MENKNEHKYLDQVPLLPSPKKWYQHKGLITILVLAVIATAAIWVYFILNQPQDLGPIVVKHKSKHVPQLTQTDTSNWKIYNNNTYEFSFQYPNGWSIQDYHEILPGFLEGKMINSSDYLGFSLDVAVLSNNKNLDLTNYYKQVLMGHEFSSDPGSNYDPKIDKIDPINVAGQPALRITTDIYSNTMVRVLVPVNSTVVRFAITSQKDSDLQSLNEIFSTFQFSTRQMADFLPHLESFFAGTLADANSIFLQKFIVPTDSDITIQTWSYAGGINGKNQVIPSGGFDPLVTLFGPNGNFINDNDDGTCPPGNFDKGNCFDSTLTEWVRPGTYTLVLTATPNFSVGNLQDGFLNKGTFGGRAHNFAVDVIVNSTATK